MFPPSQLSNELRAHFINVTKDIGSDDPYEGIETIGIGEVLRAHYALADYFYNKNDGIGGVGPRDINLLHSALSRQFTPFIGKSRWSTKFDFIATLFYGLIKNHSFYDANKRTAFLTCVIHLAKIGRKITVSHKKFEDFTVDIASGKLSNYDGYNVNDLSKSDADVQLIALYLKKNSRHIDHTPRAITYRQLKTILRGYGMDLQNADRNFIDIVRIDRRPNVEGSQIIGVRLTKITFPGWGDAIKKNELDRIRKKVNIADQNGVDSEDFFNAIDPLESQIIYYKDALERLAHR